MFELELQSFCHVSKYQSFKKKHVSRLLPFPLQEKLTTSKYLFLPKKQQKLSNNIRDLPMGLSDFVLKSLLSARTSKTFKF